DDEELQYLAVRRPVLEWALRRAVGREPLIQVHSGVRFSGTDVSAPFVVDALGRRTPLTAGVVRGSDCGVVYYSRYYRQRPGFDLPDGPWFLSPRGDLGYLGFASFPGDNRTFAAVLAVPAGVAEWRALRDPVAFQAAVATIP